MNELAAALRSVGSAKTASGIVAAGIEAARLLFGADTATVTRCATALPHSAASGPTWTGGGVRREELGLDGEGTVAHALAVFLDAPACWLVVTRATPPFAEAELEKAVLFAAFLTQTTRALEETEAVTAQQSIYRTLVEQLPTVTYYRRLDAPGGDAWFVSPQVKTILGVEPESFNRGPDQWRNMLHPDDRGWVVAEQARFDPSRATAPIQVEYRMVRADGQTIWIQNTALTVRGPDGTPRFLLGVLADITERKNAEEELRHTLKREAVSQLAASVAHDFNNVLGAILAYASHLREDAAEAEDERKFALDEITAAARRGYELTRELAAIADASAPRSKPTPQKRPPDGPTPAPAAHGTTAPTILLVDDEDAVRRASTTILVRRGYRVLAAASGYEALVLLSQPEARIDLLLTDVIMPEMGGRELAERCRAIRPELKVAFISGFTDDEVLRKAVLDADCALLQKPFSAAELIAHVRSVMTG